MGNAVLEQAKKRIADSESATGKKATYWYGMRLRPFSIGAQPDSTVAFVDCGEALAMFTDKDATLRDVKFGAIAYQDKLEDSVVEHFSLTDLNKVSVLASKEEGEIFCENILFEWKESNEKNGAITSDMVDALKQKIHKHFKEGEALKALLIAGLSKHARAQEEFKNKDKNPRVFATWEASINCLSLAEIDESLGHLYP